MNSYSKKRKVNWFQIIVPLFVCLFVLTSFFIGLYLLQPSTTLAVEEIIISLLR